MDPQAQGAHEKLGRLREILHGYGSALVCFSGGVDSTFLLKVALDALGERAVALTAESPSLAAHEQAEARKLAAQLGARHEIVESNELERGAYAQNPVDRCYFCKAELLELARPRARALGLSAVCLGTNLDDLGDHRPGLRAADEQGARHPMVEAGLHKAEIRLLSRELGLSTWNKPQLACLSSRFPYGTEITPERLARIDRFEEGLHALGFTQLRVRFHEPIARLELDPAEMARALDPALRARMVALGRQCGFAFVALDLAGYRSGALNEGLLPLKKR
ncbi:MAG TPA: ATP-dependent sacrificial sulfur transferase LarE [Polyangia bacterium]|nr:ATP-dependent sacrificial sulfur transferase LarE [Polyangia bacterium]